jgi:hypothetical protein
MWLQDFLPEMVPTARILIYGYDTRLEGSNSYASILDLAKGFLQAVKTVREHSTVCISCEYLSMAWLLIHF